MALNSGLLPVGQGSTYSVAKTTHPVKSRLLLRNSVRMLYSVMSAETEEEEVTALDSGLLRVGQVIAAHTLLLHWW